MQASLLLVLGLSASTGAQGLPQVAPSEPGESGGEIVRTLGAGVTAEGTAVWNVDAEQGSATIQEALDTASPGDTLEVLVPVHGEGFVHVTKDITLRGMTGDEVIQNTADTGASGDARAWFLVDAGVELHVRGLSFDGNGFLVHQAFRHKGFGSFEGCHFRDIQFNPSGPEYAGTAIAAFGGRVDVLDSTFKDIGRIGVFLFGAGTAGAVLERNRYTGKGVGDWLDYGFELGAGAAATLVDNVATDCRGVVTADGSNSAGVLVSTFAGPGTTAVLERNTLVGNAIGLAVGNGADNSMVEARFNRIVGNDFGVSGGSPDVWAKNNWWGCNGGPGAAGCDIAVGSGGPSTVPWLVLGLSADPEVLSFGDTSTLTADLNHNSDGIDLASLGQVPDGIETFWGGGTLGTLAPSLSQTLDGVAQTVYTAGTVPGTDTVSATVDNQTVFVDLVIEGTVSSLPELLIPDRIPAAVDTPVDVPVVLTKNGKDITAVAFSVDFDESCLDFESVTFLVPDTFDTTVFVDLADTDGELDFLVFDFPPDQTLPDGPLVSITFEPTCTPPEGGSLLAPVVFSTDPTPTFGDTLGQDVTGTSVGGSVELFGGLRGDCNGDGMLGAADLAACGLELFDDDGDFWLGVPNSTFVGDPVGCDANADTQVNAGDVSCKGRLIFGLTCDDSTAIPEAVPQGPSLTIPADLQPDGAGRVVVPVRFSAGGQAINSVVFSLDFDTSRLRFDADDPNAVRFLGDASVQSLTFQPGDTEGELDGIVADLSATPQPLAEGLMLEIVLEVTGAEDGALGGATPLRDAVRFSTDPRASFGHVGGTSVPGNAFEVLFANGFESGDTSGWSSRVD